jgi:uncharacterized protein (DUF2336 family)
MSALLELAQDTSVSGREALAFAITDLYVDSDRDFSDREQALMDEILHRLIHDVEMSVRAKLATLLADREGVPQDLIVILANDNIEVAYPILKESPLLQDEDLIELIFHRSAEHQLAIALRKTVSIPISDALVLKGNESVITALLENENAEISQRTMGYLVEQSRRFDKFQQPLLNRTELGRDLAKRMYWWVSEALQQHITEHYHVDSTELNIALREIAIEAISDFREKPVAGDSERYRLVDELQHANALSANFLIQVLREGEIPLFEAALTKLTGLESATVKRCLYERDGRRIPVLCRALQIEKSDFISIFLLSRQGRPGDHIFHPNEMSNAIALFENLEQAKAEAMIYTWRLNPDSVAVKENNETK